MLWVAGIEDDLKEGFNKALYSINQGEPWRMKERVVYTFPWFFLMFLSLSLLFLAHSPDHEQKKQKNEEAIIKTKKSVDKPYCSLAFLNFS